MLGRTDIAAALPYNRRTASIYKLVQVSNCQLLLQIKHTLLSVFILGYSILGTFDRYSNDVRKMQLLRLFGALCSIGRLATASHIEQGFEAAHSLAAKAEDRRPIYAIAHMVITIQGMKDAIKNGANSFEIDLTASDKWWADHDNSGDSAGDTAENLFKAVADEREAGMDIPFVWLDIKNPDECAGGDKNCGIEKLRGMSREILEPAGVRVLYGFYRTENSHAYGVISKSLNDNEAVVLSGEADEVLEMYPGSSVSKKQRIMDYGYTQLEVEFGNCKEDSYYTCTELRQAAGMRDQGEFGKVLSWTSTVGDSSIVADLLGKAGIDGIIYGFEVTPYYDHEDSRAAAKDITDWVANSDKHHMATNLDVPW